MENYALSRFGGCARARAGHICVRFSLHDTLSWIGLLLLNLHKNLFNIYNCLLLVYHYFHSLLSATRFPNFACNLKLLHSFIIKQYTDINNIQFQFRLIDTLFSQFFFLLDVVVVVSCPRFTDLHLKITQRVGCAFFSFILLRLLSVFLTKLVINVFFFIFQPFRAILMSFFWLYSTLYLVMSLTDRISVEFFVSFLLTLLLRVCGFVLFHLFKEKRPHSISWFYLVSPFSRPLLSCCFCFFRLF